MKISTLPIFILILPLNLVFGQLKEIVPPTPNAMKLTEFHAQKPNLYTGTASVSIPLYSINFDGWTLPISLSYNATGVRPNEEASEVGLGWALNATGIISRTVKDGDDLLKGLNAERKGYVYANAITYNFGYDWRTDAYPPVGSYYEHLGLTHPDTQPDIFNYNFFGFSGSFIIPQHQVDSSNPVKATKLTQDATLVFFNKDSQTFTVTTSQGYVGEFSVKELSTSFSSSTAATDRMACCAQNLIDIQQTKNSGRYRAISTWYLSKITSPRGEEIYFNYDLNSDGSSPYLSQSRAFGELESITSQETCLQTVQEHVYLESIVSDEIRIDFQMEPRQDLKRNILYTTGGYFPVSDPLKRFTGMTIDGLDPASTLNKSITFRQSYFNIQYQNNYQETENEVRKMRSRLDRVIIDDQEYRFYYENGYGLPDKLTKGIDHFGFYNGGNNNTQVLPPSPVSGAFLGGTTNLADTTPLAIYKQRYERLPNFNYGKAGLLSKVKFPTRGYTIFEYEAHTYLPNQTGQFYEELGSMGDNTAGGARIKSIKEYDYNDALVSSKSYKYLSDATAQNASQSPPTGKLMTPLYNRYGKRIHNATPPYAVNYIQFLYRTHSSIPGNNSAEGKVIGYSKVHEVVNKVGTIENYKNTYYFENRNPLVSTWNAVATGDPNINGQVMEIRNYDSQGKIVKQTKNQAYENVVATIPTIAYEFQSDASPYLNYLIKYSIPRTFHTPTVTIEYTAETPSGIVEATNGTITSYGKAIQTQTNLVYQTTGSTPTFLLKSKESTNSSTEIIKTEYKRPLDYTTPSTHLTYMISKNMVDPIIEEITTRNAVVIAASGNFYERESPTGSRVNLRSTYAYNRNLGTFSGTTNGQTFSPPYEKKSDFTYDLTTGKINEFTGSDGILNSFIWGHNNTLPIVHGVKLSQAQLLSAYNTAVGSGDYETTIRTQASLTGGQVTTFTHNPQVGLNQSINPAQLKTSFQYDSYARLNKVLDNTGKTLEQFQYHFKELPISRNLSLSVSNLSFGSFYYCKLPSPQILTLTNSGEDDLTINTFSMPSGFSSEWHGDLLPAGTSMEIPIEFTGGPGNYNSSITITSNRTDGPTTVTVPVSATYNSSGSSKVIQLQTNSLIVSPMFIASTVTVSNVGDACLTITDVQVSDTQNWSISMQTGVLQPGESSTLSIMRIGDPPSPAQITIYSDKTSGNNVLEVNKPTRIIGVSPANKTFASFTESSKTESVTIQNTGNGTLAVSNVTSTNSMFTVSPSSFSIAAGGSQVVDVTFTPTAYNFSQQTSTIQFVGDQTSGSNILSVTATRGETRIIQLSNSSLVFNNTGEQQVVTVSNIGNNYLDVTNVNYGTTSNWNASVNAAYLAPGASTNLTIVRTGSANENLTVTVNSNKTSGNEIIQAVANTRTINYNSITFPSFTASSVSQTLTISNTGTSTLTISNITSSNGRFTMSPINFSVASNASQDVTVTYTPTDFALQSTTITINSNATNGTGVNTVNTSAQRTETRVIQLSNSSLVFNYTGEQQIVTVTNNGNSYLNITGVSYGATSNWSASISSTNLAPGANTNLTIVRTGSANENLTVSVVSNKTSGNEVVSAVANTRTIGYNTITFPSFTAANAQQTLTITNTGNSTLTVNSITSSNGKFTISPSNFSVAASGSQNVTVTYTPTDFTSQSTTITINSNATNGTGVNTTNTSAQRTQLYQMSVSTSSIVVKPTATPQYIYINNTGNVNVIINTVGNNNTSKFTRTLWQAGGSVSATLPYTIPPGSQMVIKVTSADGQYTSATGILTITNNQGTNYQVNMSRATF